MPRKNRRMKIEYRKRLGFNPRRYMNDGPDEGRRSKPPTRRHIGPVVRGAVWFADLGAYNGTSVQYGCRPVVIISNDIGNSHADVLVVLPMTTHLKKPNQPTHVTLSSSDLMDDNPSNRFQTSMVLAEQITTISKSALCSYIGRMTGAAMERIDAAVRVQLGV